MAFRSRITPPACDVGERRWGDARASLSLIIRPRRCNVLIVVDRFRASVGDLPLVLHIWPVPAVLPFSFSFLRGGNRRFSPSETAGR